MYRVHYESTVSISVDSESPEKAIEIADRKLRELQGFLDGSGEVVISDGDPEVEEID